MKNLALACLENDCPLVHISTDYVFNGKNDRPWVEDDEIGPISVYGKSKREGEEAILEILDKFSLSGLPGCTESTAGISQGQCLNWLKTTVK